VLPTLLVILIIAVYPIIDAIRLSFLDNPLTPSAAFTGLSNYVKVLSDAQFRDSILNTLVFSVVSVFFETLFGLLIALLINQSFPGRGLVRTTILIPWAFPTIVSATIWLLMYNDQTGIITYILQSVHLLAPGDTLTRTSAGVVLAAIITLQNGIFSFQYLAPSWLTTPAEQGLMILVVLLVATTMACFPLRWS